MPVVFRKNEMEILSQALDKVAKNTNITSISSGSVVRAIIEAITKEIGDLYDIMDFNFRQNFISTASGSSLDLFGALYDTTRKTTSNLITIDKASNSFFFYLETAYGSNIVIPSGTNVFTDVSSYLGQQFSYKTTETVTIPAGKLRVAAPIKPNFSDSVFTAGKNTINYHDFTSPAGARVMCTNPKSIQAQIGYEDDAAYRARIMKAMRVTAAGTSEAIRFAALAISGVRDIKVRQAPYGFGSFEVIVIPEDLNSSNVLVERVNNALDRVRPLGVRMYTKSPSTVRLETDIQLVTPAGTNALDLSNATQRAQSAASRFVSRLLPGDPLVYNKFIQSILDSSEYVNDVIITRFSIGGIEVPRRNYQPDVDTIVVTGSINISIARQS